MGRTTVDSKNYKIHNKSDKPDNIVKKENDILNFNQDYLYSYSRKILQKIAKGESGWEDQCPDGVADLIKERGMFSYRLKYILD